MRRLLVLMVAAGLLAGCGEKTVKTDELKQAITEQYTAQGVKLRELACPDDIKGEAGAAIKCTALNPAGTKLYIEGSVTSADDDGGRFKVKTVRLTLPGKRIATRARELLEQQVGQRAAGMTCPAEVEIPTKPSVTCELATTDGKRFDTAVKVDLDGNINVAVAKTPK
jgi:hypothetical protein